MKYDYAIIGGGASGLMLAALVDLNTINASGVIIEAGSSLGTKLLMSGGGHCNITHEGSIKDFIAAYGEAGRFLRKCLYRHNNLELLHWLDEDVPMTSDESGRVFPASGRARDVLDFLMKRVRANSWDIRLNTGIRSLDELDADSVVLAAGGITFPETGSDGSMLKILSDMGIGITEPRSALAPVRVRDYPYGELAGISLRDVTVSVFPADPEGARLAKLSGDMLFTHDGFSGPAILNISRYAEPGGRLCINYGKQLDELPRRLKAFIEDRSRGPGGDIRTRKLAALLENDCFVIDSVDSRGMVTRGGIALEELNPQTMELRPGLYAIGEVIDADGMTGGYNLQMCYSTAAAVADDIMKRRGIL